MLYFKVFVADAIHLKTGERRRRGERKRVYEWRKAEKGKWRRRMG